MRRLTRAGFLLLVLFGLPQAGEPQPARLYRVGVVLQGGPYAAGVDGLRDGLKELGLEEGKQYVNLKTAKALGVTIPQALLARADEIVE